MVALWEGRFRVLRRLTLFAALLCVAFGGASDAAGTQRTWTQFETSEQGAFYFEEATTRRRGPPAARGRSHSASCGWW